MSQAKQANVTIKVSPPKKSEIRTVRILICCGLISMVAFINWFCNPEHLGYAPIFWLLTVALVFKLVKMLHEWYHYWSPSVPVMPKSDRQWTVDILTTACPGEPREMIIRTLRAMQSITYPHTSYLCDEGDDPILKKTCEELGVVHVTRQVKVDAKAGNINNALKQATGEICVVLDPDHVPVPEFLDRVLPYFEDEKIGFVQSVQAYGNQGESFIARGAAEQTYHFYGPMMMCMNTYGTTQAIGANCAFRRKALDSIGGHAAGLSEDMHTAMQIHAKGWKSIYIPEILTRGLVPSTLSAYYKQQLKWSRGTFELLFRTLPQLFRNFTWRQKLHYATLPMYFLYGVVNMIDLTIPMLALCLAQVPWEVDLGLFAAYFFPMCGFSIISRLYAQRWLLERHERGFHFAGGILRTATWWIFLIGFIYTIFKVKVPYIPTPKEDERANHWRLSLPNLGVVAVCLLVTVYGLSIDWTPYSFAMASYCALNAGMLGLVVVLSQQKLVYQLSNYLNKFRLFSLVGRGTFQLFTGSQQAVYGLLRNGPAALFAGCSLFFLSYNSISEDEERFGLYKPKEFGGFYTGIAVQNVNPDLRQCKSLEAKSHNRFEVISFQQSWDGRPFPENIMRSISSRGALPLIEWLPVQANGENIYLAIKAGKYDSYLRNCANSLISYGEPLFISFSPRFDDPKNPLYQSTSSNPLNFILAWQYVYTFFNESGVSNLTWLWWPQQAGSGKYYPGPKFVDWIGASSLNYGSHKGDKDWYTFAELYKPFREQLGHFGKPVLIGEFGSLNGQDQSSWMADAFESIEKDFHEIRSIVLRTGIKTFPFTENGQTVTYTADFTLNPETERQIALSLREKPFSEEPFLQQTLSWQTDVSKPLRSPNIKGTPGHYSLMVNGAPFYLRGVAYNTAHDWRDGNMPLTRRQLEKDFQNIKEMGANTIRRYDHSIYDRNVLNVASEYDLKVLYGFWFDPKVDYYKDSLRVKKYINEVLEKVADYKDHPAVIAWALGNETWGLLKHRYSKPYLSKVRISYVRMVEQLAQRIHELDPARPVFSCMEHEEYQLAGELVAFREGAPSVDVIGVNSYYKEQISKLNHIAWHFDSLRPYLVSEFGPRGYWDPTYNRSQDGKLLEDKENEKALWYRQQWSGYVLGNKGYNIGGFAYCWHDRMEGSYTWFGLSDYRARLKPSYYALRELWTGKKGSSLPEFTIQGPELADAGKMLEFRAHSKESVPGVTYEWRLLKDEYLEKVDVIEETDSENVIRLKLPAQPSDYRLYLFASDEQGNVSTASLPLPVRN